MEAVVFLAGEQWYGLKAEILIFVKKVDRISRDYLVHLLSLSENGFADILKNPKKARENYLEQLQYLEGLNFNRSVNFLTEHPYLLKVPLICERKKLIGIKNFTNLD